MGKNSNIDSATKAAIAVEKSLKPITRNSDKKIADSLNISRSVVCRTSYESLSDEEKDIVRRKREDLKHRAAQLTFDSIVKGQELISLADDIRHLPAVMGAAKIGNDIYRLETNQPTTINADQSNAEYWADVVRKVAEQTRNEIEAAYNRGVESNWIPPHLRDEVRVKLLGDGSVKQ